MYEIKTEDVHENFSINKEMFGFRSYSTFKSKCSDDSKKLVIRKMENETGSVSWKNLSD